MEALLLQLIDEIETIGRDAVAHRTERQCNLSIGRSRYGIAVLDERHQTAKLTGALKGSGVGSTHGITKCINRVHSTLHIAKHTLLMRKAQHLINLGNAEFLEFRDATIGTQVEQNAAKVKYYNC